MIKAIIFDCFGVVRVDATNNAYKKLGGDISKDENFIRDVMTRANSGLIPNTSTPIARRLGVSEEKWRETVRKSSDIDQEVLDYAMELRKEYKTAMLSNIGAGGLERWFGPGDLEKYFNVIIGSGDIGFAKPEPHAYEITADRLDVRLEECVMIDDKLELCEGATAVGMKAIWYHNFSQTRAELEVLLAKESKNETAAR